MRRRFSPTPLRISAEISVRYRVLVKLISTERRARCISTIYTPRPVSFSNLCNNGGNGRRVIEILMRATPADIIALDLKLILEPLVSALVPRAVSRGENETDAERNSFYVCADSCGIPRDVIKRKRRQVNSSEPFSR
jgi:hypothetical protein